MEGRNSCLRSSPSVFINWGLRRGQGGRLPSAQAPLPCGHGVSKQQELGGERLRVQAGKGCRQRLRLREQAGKGCGLALGHRRQAENKPG